VDVIGATELHATFREESRTSLFSARVALEGNLGSGRPFRGFLPRKTTPRNLFQTTVIANLPISIHVRSSSPRTDVLGHSQSSLRDWSRWECRPSTAPDFLHAALDRSAYAAFFTESRTRLFGSTKLHRKSGYVLGYSQPSLRDCSRYTLIAAFVFTPPIHCREC
jgi:hypothetical protein